ncbi:iron-sulfur binding hydrogenase [Thermosipho ferrireducens]|uniref:Iron-sulfur binding hydrogenase n=1 Tax=Thermosipho ferrireducens TaxID=2571116 RepID=A0ABX7S7M6_9BACT|nr:iron-sulfur binding hydrogenase [Thermosipho ferrireducens]QTA38584.1 iron-sulfur binding hydrogenase [Thermosipho ferrireducens]
MNLKDIVASLDAEIVFLSNDCEIIHAYTGDLLSLVMKNAKNDSIWITVQNHVNIIAVASLVGIRAIILCDDLNFPSETVEKAKSEGISLIKSRDNAFVVSGKIYQLGIR